MDELGYVYGSIPANVENQPAIGLIAHMDVVDCVPCTPMNARIVKNYDGKALTLESGDVLDPELYKGLKACAGQGSHRHRRAHAFWGRTTRRASLKS